MSNAILKPFKLLELSVISAQDLAPVCRKMRTYAVAWVHPARRLTTRVAIHGHTNPTWNDKFVFRVDDEFLYDELSALMIEIYALHWFRDIHIGTIRVIVGNLIPPTSPNNHCVKFGTRFIALQVRRPSGRPQGILNIGIALLDSSIRSMPMYSQLNHSAVGYRHLMGEEDPRNRIKDDGSDNHSQYLLPWLPKPKLRRSKSDSSSMFGSQRAARRRGKKRGSNSMISGSEVGRKRTSKRKGGSMIGSVVSDSVVVVKTGGKTGKPGSVLSGSDFGPPPQVFRGSAVSDSSSLKTPIYKPTPPPGYDKRFWDYNGSDLGAPNHKFHFELPAKGVPPITESDVGPSVSEVAAMMAKQRYNRVDEEENEIIGEWSLESSMEGLISKLERWRAELPHRIENSSSPDSSVPNGGGKRAHRRMRSDGGLFSCFGNICGIECSIVCGGPSVREKGGKVRRSQSMDQLSSLL